MKDIKNWMDGDKWTAPYRSMSTNKLRADQLACIWQERYDLVGDKKLNGHQLQELKTMVEMALDEHERIMTNRANDFLFNWTLHDPRGERWSDVEWEDLYNEYMTGQRSGYYFDEDESEFYYDF